MIQYLILHTFIKKNTLYHFIKNQKVDPSRNTRKNSGTSKIKCCPNQGMSHHIDLTSNKNNAKVMMIGNNAVTIS